MQRNTNPRRGSALLRAGRGGALVRLWLGLVASWWLVGTAGAQALALPSAIVFDAQGNLYFAETGNHVVRKFSTAGVTTTAAGTGVQGFAGDGAAAVAAELDSPAGLAIGATGDLFIADTHNHRVRKVAAATGIISTVAGTGAAAFSGDGGAATAARLDLPTALAIDAAGDVYVADTDNYRVRMIAAGTGVITTVAGDGVERFAGDGGPATAASIDSPNGLAVDAAGNLYIADTHNGRVREVSVISGVISTAAGSGPAAFSGDGGAATAAGLALPRGLTIDAAGNIYVADSANHRVRRISVAGKIATVAGQGTEAFLGDGAPAVAASLDSPHAVAISPAGLLTLADRDNQRIRQLDALPAPGPDIHTITGVGVILADALVLSGPAVAIYGNGVVTANLRGGTGATGNVAFVDTTGGQAIQLGAASLSGGTATFNTAQLGGGTHIIVASYAGDASHPAAQSAALALAVTPLSLTATANPASIRYGQAVPALSGALIGVLSQDFGKVSAVFTSTAGVLSQVGLYPISVMLTGTAAANYSVGATAGGLTIAQAPTLITMSPLAGVVALSVPITVNLQVASTTSGVPTGSATLMDGMAMLGTVQLSAGSGAFSTNALGLGTHSLSAVYTGDANFLSSTSTPAVVTVGSGPDFIIAATGATSQSIPAGSTATFQFAVAMSGPAMSSPIILAVQGAPVGATASLTPPLLPPGGSVTSFTLTIQTPFAGLERRSRPGSLGGATVLALLLMPLAGAMSKRLAFRWLILLVALGGLLFATGCGNRVNTASESTNSRTYTVTVTGTATSAAGTALQHSANVTLKVL
ncbi:MAG: Ig-like domain repeat protein [Acidobacteriota bacterium]|nr:Ig-like domain repeat protein [Acidobacteriota bacterium]